MLTVIQGISQELILSNAIQNAPYKFVEPLQLRTINTFMYKCKSESILTIGQFKLRLRFQVIFIIPTMCQRIGMRPKTYVEQWTCNWLFQIPKTKPWKQKPSCATCYQMGNLIRVFNGLFGMFEKYFCARQNETGSPVQTIDRLPSLFFPERYTASIRISICKCQECNNLQHFP